MAAARHRFEFRSEACADPATFAVVRLKGFEAISQPYRFELVLVCDDAEIDLQKVLAASAHLSILAPDDEQRRTTYAGRLSEFDQLQQAGGFTFYRAVLVPRLWQLSMYRNSEVYLGEQRVTDIVAALLRTGALSSPADFELRLHGDYRARSYVCQYQETPLDFISRWLEKEGIYYYFEQEGEREKLVLLDAASAQPDSAVAVNFRPADELDTGLAPDSVQAFMCRNRPVPRRVVLQDFNHRRASVPLVAQAEVAITGQGDELIYGENFHSLEEGERYARIRAQELLCGAQVFSGEATAVGLRSGHFMALSHHYRDSFNGRYLVTEVTHEGSQAGALLAGLKTPWGGLEGEIAYRNSFTALPVQDAAGQPLQYRPPRRTPKPRVHGTMNATIDAEGSGEYAELDAFGQYKVQVPFDRTEKGAAKGSASMRMATPYAGSDHGMHFPLHKNAEVLLSFADGDPDRPVIVGAVPNSINPSVVGDANAHFNRIRSKSGHEMLMDDTRGSETFMLQTPGGGTQFLLGAMKYPQSTVSQALDDAGGGGGGGGGSGGGRGGDDGGEGDDSRKKKEADEKEQERQKLAHEEVEETEAQLAPAGAFFKTLGDAVSFNTGSKASFSFGAENSFSISSKNEWSAGIKSELDWGFSVGVKAASSLDWKLNALPFAKINSGLSISDNDEVEFVGKTKTLHGRDSVVLRAGSVEDATLWTTDTHLKIMRGLIAAYVVANTAYQMSIAGTLREASQADKTAEAALRPLTNIVAFGLIQGYAHKIAARLEHQPSVSTMKMGSDGVALTVKKTGAPPSTVDIHSSIRMYDTDANGISIRSDKQADWTAVGATPTEIVVKPKSINVTAPTSVGIESPSISIRSGTAAQLASLHCKVGEIQAVAADTTLAMAAGEFSVKAGKASIGDGVSAKNPLVAALSTQLLAAQTAALAATVAQQQFLADKPMAQILAALDDDAVSALHALAMTEQQLDSAAMKTAAEVLRVQQELASANLLVATTIMNGLLVDGADTKIVGGPAQARVSMAGGELSHGAAKFHAGPAGVTVDGPIIKLG